MAAPASNAPPARFPLLLLILVSMALAACGGGDDGNAAADRASAADQAADAAPPPSADEIVALQEDLTLDDRAGRWTRVRPHGADGDELTPEQQRQIRRLQSLGYVAGSRLAPTMQSVVAHDPDRAWRGLNFFTSGHAPEAVLMDMDGQVLHRWGRSYREVWPDSDIARDRIDSHNWRRARLLPDGSVLAIVEGLAVMKLDRESNVVWALHNGAHHDLEVLPGGDILLLARTAHMLPRWHPRAPVLEDFIVRLSPGGEELQRVSILEAFENSPEYAGILRNIRERQGDILHTNSLEMLDGRIADRAPAFTAGRVLISVRRLDTVAVVDLDRAEVVWAMQGPFEAQHDATILPDGGLMLFNNEAGQGVSAVQVFDPATGQETWRHIGTPARPFYSRTCGTSQPLPNGNVLVTESDNGRAFEITPGGDVVWDFYNPHRAGEQDEFIATLFEVLRLPAEAWRPGG